MPHEPIPGTWHCVECQKPFTKTRRTLQKRFCTTQCRMKWHTRQLAELRAKLGEGEAQAQAQAALYTAIVGGEASTTEEK